LDGGKWEVLAYCKTDDGKEEVGGVVQRGYERVGVTQRVKGKGWRKRGEDSERERRGGGLWGE